MLSVDRCDFVKVLYMYYIMALSTPLVYIIRCACDYLPTPGEAGDASPHHWPQRVRQELPVSDPERPVAHLRRTTNQAPTLDALLHPSEVRVQWPAGVWYTTAGLTSCIYVYNDALI